MPRTNLPKYELRYRITVTVVVIGVCVAVGAVVGFVLNAAGVPLIVRLVVAIPIGWVVADRVYSLCAWLKENW